MNNFIAFRTLVIEEIRRFIRIWPQTLLPSVVTTALYFMIFGHLIGERFGDIDGVSYMDYIVPGVILMSVISNAYANVVTSFYLRKFQRNIEELLVAPVANWAILLGYVCGGIARGMLVGVIVTATSLLFTDINVHHWGVTLTIYILTATLFSLAGFVNAIFANSFDDISTIPNFVLTPLTYLGGIFYSITMLPELWQQLSLVNPILYMINAFRYGLIGVTDIRIEIAFLMTGGFILLLIIFSLVLLHKGIGIKD